MPCIPLGHAENFRKCIDARLLCVFFLVRIGLNQECFIMYRHAVPVMAIIQNVQYL